MAVLELIAGGLIFADFVYHRLKEDEEGTTNFADSITIPQTEEGGPEPYIYGKVRVTRPILAWHNTPTAYVDSGQKYAVSMFFVLGASFADGDSTNRIHRMWQGDIEYGLVGHGVAIPPFAAAVPLEELDGNGDFEDMNRGLGRVGYTRLDGTSVRPGAVEFLNGNPNQLLVEDVPAADGAKTRVGYQMITATSDFVANAAKVTSYRGVLSAFLYNCDETGAHTRFIYGDSPQLGPFNFEASSYKDNASYPATGSHARLGEDSNPINVIYDLMVAKRKLALATSRIDFPSFSRAAEVLAQESHGFSRYWDARIPAREMIREVLRQIDGVIFEDTATGKYKLKLVRSDHNYADLPHITRRNCRELQNLSIGGPTGAVNMVRVVYKNRARGYVDDSVIAQDTANAAGQDGEQREQVLHYPGITHAALASSVAYRELGWRSHDIIKCRALVNREFIDLGPGDAVRLSWTKPDISGTVFRVAGPPHHGKLTDNTIALDLISDNSYQYRSMPPRPPLPHPDIGNGLKPGLGL